MTKLLVIRGTIFFDEDSAEVDHIHDIKLVNDESELIAHLDEDPCLDYVIPQEFKGKIVFREGAAL